jgi:hypothetical protein
MAVGAPGGLVVVLALIVGAALTGCGPSARGAAPASGSSAAPGRPHAVEKFRSSRTYAAVALPVRIRIPAANVDSGLEHLGRASDGTIMVPSHPEVAGWYAEGPRPGQPGPAVILGHVDSKKGPAVFFHVAALRRGAAVDVVRADGITVRFRVTSTSRVPKTRFPTDLVYSPTLEASLRLVTCGGLIDPATGHYRDNVIVYAEPA